MYFRPTTHERVEFAEGASLQDGFSIFGVSAEELTEDLRALTNDSGAREYLAPEIATMLQEQIYLSAEISIEFQSQELSALAAALIAKEQESDELCRRIKDQYEERDRIRPRGDITVLIGWLQEREDPAASSLVTVKTAQEEILARLTEYCSRQYIFEAYLQKSSLSNEFEALTLDCVVFTHMWICRMDFY